MAMNSVTILDNSDGTGLNMKQKGTYGAGQVRPISGTGETTKNRNINVAATTHPGDDTTNTVTWTAAENVTEVTVTTKGITTGGAAQNDEAVLVLFDAIDGASALALLTETGGATADVQYDMIYLGETKTYNGTSYFSRLDVLPLNVTARVVVGAQ